VVEVVGAVIVAHVFLDVLSDVGDQRFCGCIHFRCVFNFFPLNLSRIWRFDRYGEKKKRVQRKEWRLTKAAAMAQQQDMNHRATRLLRNHNHLM